MMNNFFALPFWEMTFFSNTVLEYTVAFSVFILLYVLFKVVLVYLLHKLRKYTKKTTIGLDDLVMKMLQSISTAFYLFFAFWVALNILQLPSYIKTAFDIVLTIWSVAVVVKALGVLLTILQKAR